MTESLMQHLPKPEHVIGTAALPGLAFAACLAAAATGLADPSPHRSERQELTGLSGLLNSTQFEERIRAERQLAAFASRHPDALAETAADAEPEVAARMVQLLERIFQKNADDAGDRAERALEWLSRTDGHAALPATLALRGNARLRESRARQALEALGGEVGYTHPNSDRVRLGHAVAPITGVGFGQPAVLYGIWLHGDWNGSRQDLWHIRRFAHWPDLTIYSIRGNGIDLDDLLALSSTMPGLNIEERGPCLGIKSASDLSQCSVGTVLANSAAQKAGLKPEDEILVVGDEKVRNFGHLVEILKTYKVGDEVLMTIRRRERELDRRERELTLNVQLGSWRGVAGRDELAVPAPAPFAGPFAPNLSRRPQPVPLPEPVPSPAVPE